MYVAARFQMIVSWMSVLLLAVAVGALAPAPAMAQSNEGAMAQAPADASLEDLFVDFLHYARLGRFETADAYAKALLEHKDLDPVRLMQVANQDPESLQTLLIIINNSTIGERAARVLELIQQGELEQRKDGARIEANIEKLGGDPQQEFYAIKNLAESGEYAIPYMIEALLDPARASLKQRLINALPKIGKQAVNPLVMALRMENDDIRLHVIAALGEIGYPQAIPYLNRVHVDDSMPQMSRSAAADAIARIERISGRTMPGTPAEQFTLLGNKYYDEDDSVRADPRLTQANVWYWNDDEQRLTAVAAPESIFGAVMAMRSSEEALRLQEDKVDATALWLAGNIRREARLGFDVESGDPNEAGEPDPTRPENFPRALYFTQSAGPRFDHLVLARAVADQDAPVALGAIEALRLTAGEASLIGTENYKQPLVNALRFNDFVVRTRAALALGQALPKSQFADSQFVVPVLGKALVQTGKRQVLVIEPDTTNLNRLTGALRDGGSEVVGGEAFYAGLNRARVEFTNLSAVFVATDITEPDVVTAVAELRSEFAYANVPVILLAKPEQVATSEDLAAADPYTAYVSAAMDADALWARFDEINAETGQTPLEPEKALAMALQSAHTLRMIAADGRTVFDHTAAEPALIAALSSPAEKLQISAASVLALTATPTAQKSIAFVALDESNSKSLRIAAFGSLAESARNFGLQLEDKQTTDLVRVARDHDDLEIRTAASQALGAVNLKDNRASEIIRKFYQG